MTKRAQGASRRRQERVIKIDTTRSGVRRQHRQGRDRRRQDQCDALCRKREFRQ